MYPDFIHTEETNSTNDLLKLKLRESALPEFQVIWTDFQTSGKGQTGNSWESERGKNLLFSMLLYPHHVPIEEHFIISQLIAVSIVEVMNDIVPGFQVKWPNDIYFGNKKVGGILIENTLQNYKIKNMVVGVGLNINQTIFLSPAPNPISVSMITNTVHDRQLLLETIINRVINRYTSSSFSEIRDTYFSLLYRNTGFHYFRANGKKFKAQINTIYPDGKLELKTQIGDILHFYFKEVEFII